MGIIIQHKTSADELQIHSLKILIDLFPVLKDNPTILSQLYFLTFDQICGIIALYYGVPLFLQKGEGVAIGFRQSRTSVAKNTANSSLPLPSATDDIQDENFSKSPHRPTGDTLSVEKITNWWDYHITPSLSFKENVPEISHRETILRDIISMYRRAHTLLNYKILEKSTGDAGAAGPAGDAGAAGPAGACGDAGAADAAGDAGAGAAGPSSSRQETSSNVFEISEALENYSYHHLRKIFKKFENLPASAGTYHQCLEEIKKLCDNDDNDNDDDISDYKKRKDFWNDNYRIEWQKRQLNDDDGGGGGGDDGVDDDDDMPDLEDDEEDKDKVMAEKDDSDSGSYVGSETGSDAGDHSQNDLYGEDIQMAATSPVREKNANSNTDKIPFFCPEK